MRPISFIQTPFREKFGVPRQPLLVENALGVMEFPKDEFFSEAFRGIEQFSHLWLIFEFHQVIDEGFKALIRPPRFQGKEKWGVYASRSPHRPNHLGLSVVTFKSLEVTSDKMILTVSGVDLVTGTPIYDIKPYLPYSDAHPEARSGSFQEAPKKWPVFWNLKPEISDSLKSLIENVIALDPRPAFDQDQSFGVSIAGYNVRFYFQDETFFITELIKEEL